MSPNIIKWAGLENVCGPTCDRFHSGNLNSCDNSVCHITCYRHYVSYL